jgi:hypothetical protein
MRREKCVLLLFKCLPILLTGYAAINVHLFIYLFIIKNLKQTLCAPIQPPPPLYRVDSLTRINQLLSAHNSVTSDALTVPCTVQIMGVGRVAG